MASAGPIPRCPNDGLALIQVEALLEADGDPFLGTTVAGRFVVVGRVGAGSMGTVYCARQEAMGRDVALKILRADRALDAMAKARFAREARAMSLLSSPYTVTVFDFGEIPDPRGDDLAPADASLYLAMELLEGESLGARLRRRGRLAIEEATRITREALCSLAEAHDKGIIHRDLKPDNLFLARSPREPSGETVKVLDFGIAKLRIEPTVDALETQAGTVFGTPRYMSPEQAQGKELDARSDLYTLGVLLYQMLVGRAPFVDDDAVVVMARHIKSIAVPPIEAAPNADIGADLSALVMRVLAKDPDDRPLTAQAFLAQLDAIRSRPTGHRASPVPSLARGRDGGPGASGEMAPVVHDELGASPSASRPVPFLHRKVAGLLTSTLAGFVIVALVALAAALVVLGALRPAHVATARAEIAHLVTARRLSLLQAEAATSAAPSAAPAVPSPVASAEAELPPAPTSGALAKPAPGARSLKPTSGSAAPFPPASLPASSSPAGKAGRGKQYKKFD